MNSFVIFIFSTISMNTLFKPPLQCHLWQKSELVRDDIINNFNIIHTFIDRSHYMTQIRQCKECKQLYYFEYYEHEDWLTGNDPEHLTYIPIDSECAIEAMLDKMPIELLQFSPRLQSDWPVKEGEREVRWIGK